MGRLKEMGKTIALVVFVVLLLVWAVWDQFSKWIVTVDAQSNEVLYVCSRCKEMHIQFPGQEPWVTPNKCPRCERRMTNAFNH